jgi:hypothetical protein
MHSPPRVLCRYGTGTGTRPGGQANVSEFPPNDWGDGEQVRPLYDEKEAPYALVGGDKSVTFDEFEQQAVPEFFEQYIEELDEEGEGDGDRRRNYYQLPEVAKDEAVIDSTGAFVMVYKDGAGHVVLSFRGTYSSRDYSNIVRTAARTIRAIVAAANARARVL